MLPLCVAIPVILEAYVREDIYIMRVLLGHDLRVIESRGQMVMIN